MDFAELPKEGDNRIKIIQNGDLVLIYERHDSLDHIYMKSGEIYSNKFGTFYHDDIIGKHYGSRIQSRSKKGYIYVLKPTPELWSSAVYTRTQIVNETDAAFVTSMLNVSPGMTVVESGTGSGCMTLSLARAVSPHGHVYTYEYNDVRAKTAAEEFKKLKVDNLITVTHRDICGKYRENGGGFSGRTPSSVDAIFLDVPEPWLALDSAKEILKPGASICCYSPCIEQVQKTVEKLNELNFLTIRMFEIRLKSYDTRINKYETLDMGLSDEDNYIMNQSHRDVNNIYYKKHPDNKEEIENEVMKLTEKDLLPFLKKPTNKDEDNNNNNDNDDEDNGPKNKKRKYIQENDLTEEEEKEILEAIPKAERENMLERLRNRIRNRPKPSINGDYTMYIARPVTTMKGHTAFLTFAYRSLDT